LVCVFWNSGCEEEEEEEEEVVVVVVRELL
jgi:hypothetical protein